MSEMSEMTLEEAKEFVRYYQTRTLEELDRLDDEKLLEALRIVREANKG